MGLKQTSNKGREGKKQRLRGKKATVQVNDKAEKILQEM